MINIQFFLYGVPKGSIGLADNTIELEPKLNRSTMVKYKFNINGTCGKFAELTETNLR